jgi:hypothetical protein
MKKCEKQSKQRGNTEICSSQGPGVCNAYFFRSLNLCNVGTLASIYNLKSMVLYMSFHRFLLAVESRDLSQADKSIIIVLSSFPKLIDW